MDEVRLIVADAFGRTRMIAVRDTAAIGRSRRADVRIDDPAVSRFHCMVGRMAPTSGRRDGGGGWMVKDLGSENGTYLNRRRIRGPARLADGDTIRLGRTRRIRFELPAAAPGASERV